MPRIRSGASTSFAAQELLRPSQDHRVGREHGDDPRLARRRHVLPGEIVAIVVTLLDQLLVGSKRPEPGAGVVSLHARGGACPLALAGTRHQLRIEHAALDQIPFALEEPNLVGGERAHRLIDYRVIRRWAANHSSCGVHASRQVTSLWYGLGAVGGACSHAYHGGMGAFTVECKLRDVAQSGPEKTIAAVLVDTGSEYT